MNRTLNLTLIFSIGLIFSACSSNTGGSSAECTSNSDCDGGWVCESNECIQLCAIQSDCNDGHICGTEGFCIPQSESDALPLITSVTGNGQGDGTIIKDGMLIAGENLVDASFELRDASGAIALSVRSQDATGAELVFPSDIVSGAYTLVATNTAGSDQESVQLTLPELGGDELLRRVNEDATGKLVLDRLPTGTGTGQIALGDHAHDADYAPSIVGDSESKAAYDCTHILATNPRSQTGEYWLDPSGTGDTFKVVCDMNTEGGGWIDLVATWHMTGADTTALFDRFFVPNKDTVIIDSSAATNVVFTQGILLDMSSSAGGSHTDGFHFQPSDIRYTQIRLTYQMQGANGNTADNRCPGGDIESSWIPLNGPGWNGGYVESFLSSCPDEFSCIQGSPTIPRDEPISASFTANGLTSHTTLLTWSGSNNGPQSLHCARDFKIPSEKPAAFFTKLLIRSNSTPVPVR
ncbi:hypothetical protein KAI87_00390, partial [Myxococcota bacterium]|nr:hypothetical protein [Myxococcota bacterium]